MSRHMVVLAATFAVIGSIPALAGPNPDNAQCAAELMQNLAEFSRIDSIVTRQGTARTEQERHSFLNAALTDLNADADGMKLLLEQSKQLQAKIDSHTASLGVLGQYALDSSRQLRQMANPRVVERFTNTFCSDPSKRKIIESPPANHHSLVVECGAFSLLVASPHEDEISVCEHANPIFGPSTRSNHRVINVERCSTVSVVSEGGKFAEHRFVDVSNGDRHEPTEGHLEYTPTGMIRSLRKVGWVANKCRRADSKEAIDEAFTIKSILDGNPPTDHVETRKLAPGSQEDIK